MSTCVEAAIETDALIDHQSNPPGWPAAARCAQPATGGHEAAEEPFEGRPGPRERAGYVGLWADFFASSPRR